MNGISVAKIVRGVGVLDKVSEASCVKSKALGCRDL